MRRRALSLLAALGLVAVLPECSLACEAPRWSSTAPEGGDTLTACARPMLFAMPGQSGDAPGWLVLRDREGWIRGVTSLDMVQTLDMPAEWDRSRVTVPLHADMRRGEALSPPAGFLTDRWWRLRALLGLTPADTEHR
ncbi:hypothetical protein [Muricoccus radiodurans]|uniref:hypothetical protein n=1 Tax=Muricoccus radiodurans TaxID=2231721 RepID=UPI003CF1E409